MLRLRDMAFRLVPVLVVVWAALAVLGAATYLAASRGPRDARPLDNQHGEEHVREEDGF